MKFTKVQACGNDFILIDKFIDPLTTEYSLKNIQFWCQRHVGIGADGVLLIKKATQTKLPQMIIFNSDGSRAEMCGNGLRCVALYLKRRNLIFEGGEIKTDAGVFKVKFHLDRHFKDAEDQEKKIQSVEDWVGVLMKTPTHIHTRTLPFDISSGKSPPPLPLYCLSLGNPHAITFHTAAFEHKSILATKWSTHFKEGINLSFARLISPTHIELCVHERGCGWTQACGTGACATAFAAVQLGHSPINRLLTIKLPGGTLKVIINEDGVEMWGEGVEVFEGEVPVF